MIKIAARLGKPGHRTLLSLTRVARPERTAGLPTASREPAAPGFTRVRLPSLGLPREARRERPSYPRIQSPITLR